jgi:hypothetical protein
MEELTELAKYGVVGIAIALILAICWIVDKFLKFLAKSNETLERNTQATTEMHEFLRNLNGALRQAIQDKIKS